MSNMTASTVICHHIFLNSKQDKIALFVLVLATNTETMNGINAESAEHISEVPSLLEESRCLMYIKTCHLATQECNQMLIAQFAMVQDINIRKSKKIGECVRFAQKNTIHQ